MSDRDQPPEDSVVRCVKIGAFCGVAVPVLAFVISYVFFPANGDNWNLLEFPSLLWATVFMCVCLLPVGIWVGAIVGDVLKHRREIADLRANLNHAEACVRALAAKNLGEIGLDEKDTLCGLTLLLQDEDRRVRDAAEQAIKNIERLK